jgi:16S rRNA (uracil1498-N3)-methyltransferase
VLPRFYAPDLEDGVSQITLPPEEARHLTRVLRLSAGDEVAVFNGRGLEYRARVEVAVRDAVSLRAVEPLTVPRLLPTEITVVQAVLKGGSMDDAVRDATMMGAAAIQPVLTAHTDVKFAQVMRPAAVERWRRVALAAVKQSRRATLPVIAEPRSFDDWIASPVEEIRLLFVEPSAGRPARPVKALLANPIPARAAILLGPEGGWSAEEVDAALASGSIALTLGSITLRAESMPVAALAALAAIWQPSS